MHIGYPLSLVISKWVTFIKEVIMRHATQTADVVEQNRFSDFVRFYSVNIIISFSTSTCLLYDSMILIFRYLPNDKMII